ncbi:J domain-containing protein [Streptomyces fimicarius]|uniref:J domain-containing protein n=1 Tax=Streptomyces griseus TaxID=1911 RepID=UPI0036E07960
MSDEAAGVPTTRNDEDRQDNDRQNSGRTDAPGPAPEAQDAPGAPGDSGAADAAPRPEARLARAVQAAEQALIEFEIAVETFRVEVENFSRLHHQKLGPMYARLDELDALIAEARAARTGDPEDERKAREARAVVMPMPGVDELFHDWMDTDGLSPEAAAMLTEQPVRPPKRVRPSEEARRLYRELARKAHPDLAQDEPERQRRDEFIARVNAAYGRGDIELLKELVAEWEAGPAQPLTPLSESEELYARLEWLSRRKELLTVLAKELEEGAIGSMLRMAPDDPDQLLEDIAEQLLGEVSRREAELAELVQ